MKRVSKRPVDHFEGKWEKGKKYTLYAIVKNNGTLFRSLTPKEKEEPYVIYDSTNETFSANAGWEIVEMSEDSRLSAMGGNGGSITDAVKYTPQSLTSEQQQQARTNIGAGTYDKPASGIPASDLESGVIPVGDEEDIDQNEDGKLQFANRVYNSAQPNGLGYKILRKNASFASQVTAANTIYEIRYDFDLDNTSVTIPAGCVLKFNGGKLNNGTLVGSKSVIDADRITVFDNISFSGEWSVPSAFPEWFGAKAEDNATDSRPGIQKCVDSFGNTNLRGNYFLLSDDGNGVGITLGDNAGIYGEDTPGNTHKTSITSLDSSITKIIKVSSTNTLRGFAIVGTMSEYDASDTSVAIYGNGGARHRFDTIDIQNVGVAMDLTCYLSVFIRVIAHQVGGGFYIHGGGSSSTQTSVTMIGCYVFGFIHFCYKFEYLAYSTLISCAADTEKYALANSNYRGAYCLIACKNISLINCGNEDSSQCLWLEDSTDINASIYRISTYNSNYSTRFEQNIYTQRCKNCKVNIAGQISGLPLVFAKLNGRSDYDHNEFNIPSDKISFFTGGSDSAPTGERFIDLTIKGVSITLSNVGYAEVKNYNYIHPADIILDYSTAGTYYLQPTPIYDDYGTKRFVYRGGTLGSQTMRIYGATRKVFQGLREVVFEKLLFNDDILNASFADTELVEFKDTPVRFDNCTIRTKSTSILGAIIKSNRTCVLKDTIIVACGTISNNIHFSTGPVESTVIVANILSRIPSSSSEKAFLPENTTMVFSDGTIAKNIGNSVNAHAEIILSASDVISDLFGTLSADEKALLVGSCATQNGNRYFFDGASWVQMN